MTLTFFQNIAFPIVTFAVNRLIKWRVILCILYCVLQWQKALLLIFRGI